MNKKTTLVILILVIVCILLLSCVPNRTIKKFGKAGDYLFMYTTHNINVELEHSIGFVIEYSGNNTYYTTIINSSEYIIYFNPAFYALEYYYDNMWVNISHDVVFTMMRSHLNPDESYIQKIDLNYIPYSLVEGKYRIKQTVTTSDSSEPEFDHDVYAELRIS